MFATQQYMDAQSDRPGKRGRDDEQEPPNGPKRLQSLPLRTSPKAAQQWPPSATVTPLNSSPAAGHVIDQAAVDPSLFQPELGQPSSSSLDADMDMTADAPQMHHHHAGHLGIGQGTLDATTRMPTPIQPSFAAQVRGQQCEWAAADNASSGMQPMGPGSQRGVPRSMGSTSDWQAVQNNRRLPSPISECDDAMSGQFQDEGQDVPDHCTHSIQEMEGQSHEMEHPNAMMDLERPHTADADGSESPGPSPSHRRHMRSKHTINTWTWQPGMKRSFSIGYRADCEKCRLKVPGHFNHIIIS